MVDFFRSVFGRIVLVIGTVIIVVVAGNQIFVATTGMQNASRLKEMAEQTLLRAERASDYALITISDLIVSYHGTCDASAREQLSRALYTRGVVKDLRIMSAEGVIKCAGLTQMPDVPMAQYLPGRGIAGSAPNIKFHHMGGGDGGLMGISWISSPDLVFLAVISVDSLMFDVFPESLRQSSSASLLLAGDAIARYTPDSLVFEDADQHVFTAASTRFPLMAQLSVGPDVLAGWNREAEPFIIVATGLIGLVLGGLLVLALAQQDNVMVAMREALRRKEFIAHIQPVFDLQTKQIVGGEALARWQKADGTLVSPARFINIAEECDLIVPITWQIIDSALGQTADFLRWNKGFRIGFNITPDHLISDGFIEDFCARIQEHDVSSRSIVIELTERQDFANIEAARARICDLRELGFQVYLDDTGTGHNGLSNVQSLSVDVIKIDKHFVDMIGVDKVAAKIVEMLVRLAEDLNMSTVAEGIETEEQLTALRACGVERGQGFLVSAAVPAKDFESLVLATSTLPSRVRAA